jgi:hypothetical protein
VSNGVFCAFIAEKLQAGRVKRVGIVAVAEARRQFGNPEESECLALKAANKQHGDDRV